MTVNYLGVVELTRHVVPDMLTRDSGHVLVISSVQGLLPTPWRSGYTASKHAVQAWADSLRSELCDTGVSVSVVSPGYVNTNLSRNALTSSGNNMMIVIIGGKVELCHTLNLHGQGIVCLYEKKMHRMQRRFSYFFRVWTYFNSRYRNN